MGPIAPSSEKNAINSPAQADEEQWRSCREGSTRRPPVASRQRHRKAGLRLCARPECTCPRWGGRRGLGTPLPVEDCGGIVSRRLSCLLGCFGACSDQRRRPAPQRMPGAAKGREWVLGYLPVVLFLLAFCLLFSSGSPLPA